LKWNKVYKDIIIDGSFGPGWFVLVLVFLIVLLAIGIFVIVAARQLTRPLHDKNIARLSFAFYAFSILILMVAMLNTPFDHVLRATKFGGGVKVDVDLRDQASLTD